jgi:Amidase
VPDYRAALVRDLRNVRIGVVRHFWEEDHPANDEIRTAMNAAIAVFRDLGATIADVRLRPLQNYCDVKIIIGESELYAIHERDLMQRTSEFCDDFLGRCLPAILIRAIDLAQATREHRQILEEMTDVYARYDVLVTASAYGPAPKFGTYQTIEWFWKGPSVTTPFNVTGGPAISICNGFSQSGLPLGMQVAGAPFNDATVLRVAYAYEQTTEWSRQRPRIDKNDVAPTLDPVSQPRWTGRNDDKALIDEVHQSIRRSGLTLNGDQIEQVINAAPYVRLRCDRLHGQGRSAPGPANIFCFPDSQIYPTIAKPKNTNVRLEHDTHERLPTRTGE